MSLQHMKAARSVSPQGLKGVPRGQKRGFTPAQLEVLRINLGNAADLASLALLNVGVDTMLRSSDLRALRVDAVLAADGQIRDTFVLQQRKAQRLVTCVLTHNAKSALSAFIDSAGLSGEDLLFPFTERTLQRRVKEWAAQLGLDPSIYSSHSLRRTKASVIYDRTKDVERVRILLGHRWITSTQSYLGCSTDDALQLARQHAI